MDKVCFRCRMVSNLMDEACFGAGWCPAGMELHTQSVRPRRNATGYTQQSLLCYNKGHEEKEYNSQKWELFTHMSVPLFLFSVQRY